MIEETAGYDALVADDAGRPGLRDALELDGGPGLRPYRAVVVHAGAGVEPALEQSAIVLHRRYFSAAAPVAERAACVCLEVGLDGTGGFSAWRAVVGWGAGCGEGSGVTRPAFAADVSAPPYRIGLSELEVRLCHDQPKGAVEALLASAPHLFAIESLVDEAAHMRAEDPIAFRLRHLDDGRLVRALERVQAASGWGRLGRTGRGVACARVGTARAAAVFEVSLTHDAHVTIEHAWFATGGRGEVAPELRMALAGPAIANALFDACGARVRRLPIHPRDVLRALP